MRRKGFFSMQLPGTHHLAASVCPYLMLQLSRFQVSCLQLHPFQLPAVQRPRSQKDSMSATRRIKLASAAETVFKDDIPNHWAKAQQNIERCMPVSTGHTLESIEDLRRAPVQTQPLPPGSWLWQELSISGLCPRAFCVVGWFENAGLYEALAQ